MSLTRRFIAIYSALGFFSRIVQVLAVLALLNLNDYFTSPEQLASLLPIGLVILTVLILVSSADSISSAIARQLVERLAIVQRSYDINPYPDTSKGKIVQQHQFLRLVFFPLASTIFTLPFLIVVISTTTPYLFVLSIFQGLANSIIVRQFNRQQGPATNRLGKARELLIKTKAVYPPFDDLTPLSALNDDTSLLTNGMLANNAESRDALMRKKRDLLKTSNIVFRGIILIVSAVLAMFQLSSLSAVVGFFILNNTLRYAIVVLCEYIWRPSDAPDLRKCTQLIRQALKDSHALMQDLANAQLNQYTARHDFDKTMRPRLSLKPYIRFKDFKLLQLSPKNCTLIKGLTGRVEVLPVNIVHVVGTPLINGITEACARQAINESAYATDGIAVCAQTKFDYLLWSQLPIASVNNLRIESARIVDCLPQIYAERIASMVSDYRLNRYYLDDDDEDHLGIQSLNRRQARRLRSLVALLDTIVNPHSLWLLPFLLDVFEDEQVSSLLDFYRLEASPDQRSIFLVSRKQSLDPSLYCLCELKSSSIQRCK